MVSCAASASAGLPAEPGHQRQQDGRALPDALHLLQVLHRGVQHGGEGAVPLHQGVGDGVGVPPGDGVVQQQLQGLVVGEALQSRSAETAGASSPGVRRGCPWRRLLSLKRPFRAQIWNILLYHRPPCYHKRNSHLENGSAAVFEGPVKLWEAFSCRLDRGLKLA